MLVLADSYATAAVPQLGLIVHREPRMNWFGDTETEKSGNVCSYSPIYKRKNCMHALRTQHTHACNLEDEASRYQDREIKT